MLMSLSMMTLTGGLSAVAFRLGLIHHGGIEEARARRRATLRSDVGWGDAWLDEIRYARSAFETGDRA